MAPDRSPLLLGVFLGMDGHCECLCQYNARDPPMLSGGHGRHTGVIKFYENPLTGTERSIVLT